MNNEILGIFKPKFYPLYDLMIIIIILIVLSAPGIFTCFLTEIAWEGKYIALLVGFGVILLMSLIIGCLIYLKSSYRTMCYTLYKDKLILRCGPFKSIISYSQIKKIYEKVDLDYLALCKLGLFVTNYALGPIYLGGYGWITLYATDYKNVIVIETEKKRYGITPQESERFLSELKAKIESENRN